MFIVKLNYRIEALDILLNEDCILTRYYPLIPYKKTLIKNLIDFGCKTKNDCLSLTDDQLMQFGLSDVAMLSLFKAFLCLYDISKQKFKELTDFTTTDEVKISLYELFKLPGVRLARANLYYQAGYTSLQLLACTTAEEIIVSTTNIIANKHLLCKPPLLKEAKTHIAVAKALTTLNE